MPLDLEASGDVALRVHVITWKQVKCAALLLARSRYICGFRSLRMASRNTYWTHLVSMSQWQTIPRPFWMLPNAFFEKTAKSIGVVMSARPHVSDFSWKAWTYLWDGWQFCFVFRRNLIQIFIRNVAILNEVFRCIPRFFQVNDEIQSVVFIGRLHAVEHMALLMKWPTMPPDLWW